MLLSESECHLGGALKSLLSSSSGIVAVVGGSERWGLDWLVL